MFIYNLSGLLFEQIVYYDIIVSNFNQVIYIHLQVSILDRKITSTYNADLSHKQMIYDDHTYFIH